MFPDFIALKYELTQILTKGLSENIKAGTPLADVREYRMHEGNRFTVFRDDGSSETTFPQQHRAGFRTDPIEVNNKGYKVIDESLQKVRDEMRSSQSKSMFDCITEAAEEVGNVINAKGQPITAELILDLYETGNWSFDEDGNWNGMQIIYNPIHNARMQAERKRLETEPELKRRFEEIVKRKKEEWDVRQANRKLVD